MPSAPDEVPDEVSAEIPERLVPGPAEAVQPGPGHAARPPEPRQRVARTTAQPRSGGRARDVTASDDGLSPAASRSHLVSRILRRPATRAEFTPPAPLESEGTAAEQHTPQ